MLVLSDALRYGLDGVAGTLGAGEGSVALEAGAFDGGSQAGERNAQDLGGEERGACGQSDVASAAGVDIGAEVRKSARWGYKLGQEVGKQFGEGVAGTASVASAEAVAERSKGRPCEGCWKGTCKDRGMIEDRTLPLAEVPFDGEA